MTSSPIDPISFLKQLVAIDSTSARSNLPVIELLESQLEALGFATARQQWSDSRGVAKANLIAQRGRGKAALAFVGHTDCVPFDPAWSDALAGRIDGGKLYGRGSADTKGFIAAAISAASSAAQRDSALMLLFTADEEVGCLGARRLIDFFAGNPEWQPPARAIIGEPTRMVPVLGHKGYCQAEIEITGAEGHSAFPETGASAILPAGRLLRELEALGERLTAEANPLFAPPYTTLNIGLIQGGTAKNIIPGACRLTLEWRPVPGQDPRRVFNEVERLVAALNTGRVKAAITPVRLDAGVEVARGELIRLLEEKSGHRAETIPFGTELPQLVQLGAEGCVFGPGDIRVAHKTGEFIPLDELRDATAILQGAVARFC